MNRKLTYAITTMVFTLALVAAPTKAHASFENFLTIGDSGEGDSGSHGVGGSTLTGRFIQWLDSIGIR